MPTYPFKAYRHSFKTDSELLENARKQAEIMEKRRTIRDFQSKAIPKSVIDALIQTASTAPSGAHKQPWTFCAVSNPDIKREIRKAAEKEEQENYSGRMSAEWLEDLAPLGTNEVKPFLEEAPWLIVVFKHTYALKNGVKRKNYYVNESVGLACGFLLNAIHQAGLVSLTHTPSPMNFLQAILNRPENEKPYLLIPVGHPKEGAMVPDIHRKEISKVAKYYI